MSDWLTILTVLYLLVGLAVYALTDPRGFAAKVESKLWVVPFGVIDRHLFVFVAFLWPLWLVIVCKSQRS